MYLKLSSKKILHKIEPYYLIIKVMLLNFHQPHVILYLIHFGYSQLIDFSE
jgi:hypothetical protein